jgi:hypothetical protein
MTFVVTYYCPHCGAFAELERDEYLADKAVTPFPFEGWEYATPDEDYEAADGVAFVCGEREGPKLSWRPGEWNAGGDEWSVDSGERNAEEGGESIGDVGCGRPFYLSFVRFEDGEEIDPRKPSAG